VGDEVQPGATVDRELWERFREEVKRRRGGVRGHLKTELENALRGYIHGGDATPAEIDARLQRIEAAVGAAESDGGTDARSAENTHTREPTVTERPAPNAPTHKKVAYLAHRFREANDFDPSEAAMVPRRMLRETVKDEYGFRRDTAQRYVEELIDRFDLRDHPRPDADTLVTESKFEELLTDHRADADDRIEDL
jgi:hypothetical protein